MSSLSIPRPKKLSDGHFIGDLTKLLERRKIKCGDPLSLESFGSELTSNSILRSDLFTLCTAISHMGEEDLSGEELLVLVGRAVGGAEVCRGDGAVEIPDTMRAVFLTGFDAWGKRGSELNEPLPWPPPRPQLARSGPLPEAADDFTAGPEPLTSKAPATGLHSIQEALEIAKKRSPTGLAQPPRSSAAATNVDGLTISELKTLLEDIEHRMSRIQPHLSQLNSIVDSAATDFRPSKRGSNPEDLTTMKGASAKAQPASLLAGRPSPSLAGSLAAVASSEAARRSPVTDVSEDAFLARHPYLRPSKRSVPDLPFAILPQQPIDLPPPVAPRAIPSDGVEDSVWLTPSAVPVAVSVDLPFPVFAAAPVAVADVVPPVSVTSLTPAALPQAAARPLPLASADLPGTYENPATGLNPIGAALVYIMEWVRANPRLVFALTAILLVVPTGFVGLLVYDDLHPKTIIRYSDKPAAALATPDLAGDPLAGVASITPGAAADSQQRSAATDPHPTARTQSPVTHNGTNRDTPRQASPLSKPPAKADVWPPSPDRMSAPETPPSRPLAAPSSATLPASGALRPSQLTGPPPSAIYVPSSTMIKYAVFAPKPVYPANQARMADGSVVVQITVSKQGDVTSARAISGPVEFRSAAVQSVRGWHFRPYLFSGSPADVETMLEVPFKSE